MKTVLVFLLIICSTCVCAEIAEDSPIAFGVGDLKAAIKKAGVTAGDVELVISLSSAASDPLAKSALARLPEKPESFVIVKNDKKIAIVGRDEVGAMYGCLELAERLKMYGKAALKINEPIIQSPAIMFRAVNSFITLPYGDEDWDNWYFLQEDYWRTFIDQLARARINWIDLHGMYNIKSTGFPNIYPYFITSDKFPEAGLPPEKAKRNLDMLKKIMRMAKNRGIKFALMSYSAGWENVGLRDAPYENSTENLIEYTRDVVRKMIDSCPELDMIGFRIGESGQPDTFYRDTYIPAIKSASRKISLYTRSWRTSKDKILEIGNEFPGRFFVEVKYNGEHFGPPYIIAGGRMAGWKDYSYEDYFSYPQNYRVIFQLRANGTHRFFPWGNPEMAARANRCSLLGGAIGLSIEPIDAYYPKYDFRHKDNSPNKWYKWQHQRDWFWYQVWGRTAYNPNLGNRDDLWIAMFEERFGPAGEDLYKAMKWASMIVPDAITSNCFGPDHRNHAPELEWGDNVKAWSKSLPFDTQNVMSPGEWVDNLMNGKLSARATPLSMSAYLAKEVEMIRHHLELAKSRIKKKTPEFNDLVTELTMLSHLGDYYSHKLKAGALFAAMQATMNTDGCDENAGAEAIRKELTSARSAWMSLAALGSRYYKPFVDTLRMRTENFTWAKEAEKLFVDFKVLDETLAEITAAPDKKQPALNIWPKGDLQGPSISDVKVITKSPHPGSKKLIITAKISDPAGIGGAYLKVKPLPSTFDWSAVPMEAVGDVYEAEADISPVGLMWCIEAVDKDGNGTMWPDFRIDMPYKIVPPWKYSGK